MTQSFPWALSLGEVKIKALEKSGKLCYWVGLDSESFGQFAKDQKQRARLRSSFQDA